MTLRREFVSFATSGELAFAELCRRFGISRKTGYKWLHRFQAEGDAALADQSRRPRRTPTRSAAGVEEQVVALRRQHPAWGGRKLAKRLRVLGFDPVPAPSTITHILRRHGLIGEPTQTGHHHWQRFEHAQPNDLWQMDFKGDFALGTERCYPLTALDDHSRFNLILAAGPGTRTNWVQAQLAETFRQYGLPLRINVDNGQPWGSPAAATHGLSKLTLWLIRLNVRVSFSRPAHPQTNGKDERFHRTLEAEVLRRPPFRDFAEVQRAFDDWRHIYNHIRPHESLGLEVPASRYRPSPRAFPEALPPIEYGPDDKVLIVGWNGIVRFKAITIKLSSALHGEPIAMRPEPGLDEVYSIYYCHHLIDQLDLRKHSA